MQVVLAEATEAAAEAVKVAVIPKLKDIVSHPETAYETLGKQAQIVALLDYLTAAVHLSTACAKNAEETYKLHEKLGATKEENNYKEAIYKLLYGSSE